MSVPPKACLHISSFFLASCTNERECMYYSQGVGYFQKNEHVDGDQIFLLTSELSAKCGYINGTTVWIFKIEKVWPCRHRHTCWCVCVWGGLNARGVYFYTIFGKLEFNVNTCPQGIFTKLVSALEPIHRAGLALILNRKSVVLQRRA